MSIWCPGKWGAGGDRRHRRGPGKPLVHVHKVVGLEDGQTRDGHLLHALTSPTLEVFVTEEPATLSKKPDGYPGLTLFDPVQ